MEDIFNYNKNDNYYKILGCDRYSDVDQIMKEYRQKVLKCHPDKVGGIASSDEFNRLQRAKEVLTSKQDRMEYDKWLDSGIALPFEKWISMSRNIHSSMHWMKIRQTNPMIPFDSEEEAEINPKSNGDKNVFWERDSTDDEILQKFRNYEL